MRNDGSIALEVEGEFLEMKNYLPDFFNYNEMQENKCGKGKKLKSPLRYRKIEITEKEKVVYTLSSPLNTDLEHDAYAIYSEGWLPPGLHGDDDVIYLLDINAYKILTGDKDTPGFAKRLNKRASLIDLTGVIVEGFHQRIQTNKEIKNFIDEVYGKVTEKMPHCRILSKYHAYRNAIIIRNLFKENFIPLYPILQDIWEVRKGNQLKAEETAYGLNQFQNILEKHKRKNIDRFWAICLSSFLDKKNLHAWKVLNLGTQAYSEELIYNALMDISLFETFLLLQKSRGERYALVTADHHAASLFCLMNANFDKDLVETSFDDNMLPEIKRYSNIIKI